MERPSEGEEGREEGGDFTWSPTLAALLASLEGVLKEAMGVEGATGGWGGWGWGLATEWREAVESWAARAVAGVRGTVVVAMEAGVVAREAGSALVAGVAMGEAEEVERVEEEEATWRRDNNIRYENQKRRW